MADGIYDLRPQLYYDGAWHDAPLHDNRSVSIVRGRVDEFAEPTHSTFAVVADNRALDYHPRNPISPLYGLAGRNTPARITVDGDVRVAGEVAQWSPDRTGDFDPAAGRGDAWCGIAGAGILRRLSQGTPPVSSALRQAVAAAEPAWYWPMEDAAASTQIASGLVGGAPLSVDLTVNGGVSLAADATLVGSSALPITTQGPVATQQNGIVASSGQLPRLAVTDWSFSWWVRLPVIGESSDATDYSAQAEVFITSDGLDIQYWRATVFYDKAGDEDRFVVAAFPDPLEAADPIGGYGQIIAVVPHSDGWREVRVRVQTGATLTHTLYLDGQQVASQTDATAMDEGVPVGARVTFRSKSPSVLPLSMGHLAVWSSNFDSYGETASAAAGWPGETAGTRFLRLCAEGNVPASLVGDVADTPAMGPQPADTFVNLLTEIERTDGGLLYEPRDQVGLAYRTRASLYTQAPKLVLDWAQGQVANPFQPTLDDQATRNDITVTRRSGSSARAVLDTGPMSTLPPPDGVGRVETEIQVNPATDDALPGLAAWALHLGTVEDVRWPRVTVDLDACPELAAAASSVDIGDLIRIVNTPLDVSPDHIDLIVLGYTETNGPRRRKIVFNCRPASPWRVGRWDAFRWDSAASTLDTAVDTTQTSLPVAVADGVWWTTDPSSTPFDVSAGGERMTVTAVAAPVAGVQIMTVTRAVNGVIKSHPAGTPVHVWDSGRWAL